MSITDASIGDKWKEIIHAKKPGEGSVTWAIRLVRWATKEQEQFWQMKLQAKQEELERAQDTLAARIQKAEKIT